MTADNNTNSNEWQQRLERFQALHLLYQADDEWGPLCVATRDESSAGRLRKIDAAQREKWEAEHVEAYDRHERELARHMASIYDPMIAAGLALIRTPAPDLAAVRIKHGACNDAIDLPSYEDEDGEFFAIIKADVRRLTGLEVQ